MKKSLNGLCIKKYNVIYCVVFCVVMLGLSGCGQVSDAFGGQGDISGNHSIETGNDLGESGSDSEEGTEKEPGQAVIGDTGMLSGQEEDSKGDLNQGTVVSGSEDLFSQGEISSGNANSSNQGASSGNGGSSNQGVSSGNGASSNQGVSSGNGGSSNQGTKPSGNEGTSNQGTKPSNQGATVSASGALSVDGTQLVDALGNPVQLRGVSTHGLAWYPGYVNEECFRQLKEEWGADVVRLAMYTAEYGGYCSGGDKNSLMALVKDGVEYAVECGLYVIIDWHILSDGNPNIYIEQAKEFFAEMSKEYGDYTNVFYEICNEPNGGTSWSEIKRYAEQVIEVIRENDEDGIILVGTPNWSQYVDQAAADPIEGYDNIMYTLHFYAATHTDALRSTMVQAVKAGLPIFVSEYGICDASGNGAIDEYQANKWVETLDEYQISYVAWNLSNKSETSAVFKGSCKKVSGFTEEDLSDSGKWLYAMLREAGSIDDTTHSEGIGTGQGTEINSGGKDDSLGNDSGSKNDTIGNNAGSQGNSSGNGSSNQGNVPEDNMGNQGSASGNDNGDKGNVAEDGGLTIKADIVNSWKQGEEVYYQYTVTITNNTGADMDGWAVSLVFSGDIGLSGSWNGIYQADGSTLAISSMDYNGSVAQGASVGDIGFILHGAENMVILEMTGN